MTLRRMPGGQKKGEESAGGSDVTILAPKPLYEADLQQS
jgi:hypothetical protein